MSEAEVKGVLQNRFGASQDILRKLDLYVTLLTKWQVAFNLISKNTVEQIWERHILDCFQIIPLLDGDKILDVGSGAGLPGVVVAIATNKEVVCLDSNSKKCFFLREVAASIKCNLVIENARLEEFLKLERTFDAVTARGFAELTSLLNVVCRYSCCGVFLKGSHFLNEESDARKRYMFHVEHFESVTNPESRILKISDVHKI